MSQITINQNNNQIIISFCYDYEKNERVDKFLSTLTALKDYLPTRSFINHLIENNHIKINQKNLKSSYQLKKNDHIEIKIPQISKSVLQPYDLKLDIQFEDENYIVINKPSGLVIHPAHGHEQDTLVNALIYHTKNLSMKNEERPGIVHRIDKETSGLLVVAKNDRSHEHLSQQFKEKTTHRIYYALVKGHPQTLQGTISSYLQRHPTDRKRYASIKENSKIKNTFDSQYENGKWAVTHFTVIEKIYLNEKFVEQAHLTQKKYPMSLVKLQLETGRTHQIRVHMSELGFPLIGDVLYGFSKLEFEKLNLKRFYLHAAELGFTDFTNQENKLFKSNWPSDDLEQMTNWGFYEPMRIRF